jgi:hypothetical protein
MSCAAIPPRPTIDLSVVFAAKAGIQNPMGKLSNGHGFPLSRKDRPHHPQVKRGFTESVRGNDGNMGQAFRSAASGAYCIGA